ncbi:hypothetical protein EVAR_37786_1 [Eumeta japonica]|uniref:Uncharacterized protein n=1 Tax=Eumeta variegata TaxID=151549 RepID=A0A4C1W8Q3_EUMVA|nr:hypothetical protein EVAR_37786_1 [Eumeta japonica]
MRLADFVAALNNSPQGGNESGWNIQNVTCYEMLTAGVLCSPLPLKMKPIPRPYSLSVNEVGIIEESLEGRRRIELQGIQIVHRQASLRSLYDSIEVLRSG